MNAKEWIAVYAERLDTEPPTDAEFKQVLELAAVAAHSSERVAAPVACWMSARAGMPLEETLRHAEGIGGGAAE